MTIRVFEVFGIAAPQGSKRGGVSAITGKTFVYEQNSKRQSEWRRDVIDTTVRVRELEGWGTLDGCIEVDIEFRLPRPASVKISKRPYPNVKPDLDKITRNTLDGLKQAGMFTDDAQVINLSVSKRYAGDTPSQSPGATIRVGLVPLPVII